jgi:tetratricopeptide (TPR) repeat protein
MEEYPIILGVYSLARDEEVGVGTTRSLKQQLTYWFVRQCSPTRFEVQPLNVFHVPSGIKKYLQDSEFLGQYTPEPRYFQIHTVPALKTLYEKIRKGEEFFAQGKFDKAENEFIKALMIDDKSIDANYGLGEVYAQKQNYEKLNTVMQVLMGLEEAFNNEHRRRLNMFGVKLRKSKCFEQSISFLSKAIELNPDDEHVHFNIARSYFDNNDMANCMDHLAKAMEIRPEFAEARRFLAYCELLEAESQVA